MPPLVPAQIGAPLVAQFAELGSIGILLILLALIINGTFSLRREVTSAREERDFWRKRAEELEDRLERYADENHERAERRGRRGEGEDGDE